MHQPFVFRILEFDDPAGLDVDQMVMRPDLRRLIPRPPATEVAPLQNALLFEQPHRPVYRRDRDMLIERRRSPVQFLNIRMVIRIGQDPRNNPALAGHLQAPFDAKTLDPRFHAFPAVIPSTRPSRQTPEATAYNARAVPGKPA